MKLLEIGRVLMSGAKLLVMDEPVAGVNPVLAHEIFRRLTELRDQMGLTIFLVEHRLEIALQRHRGSLCYGLRQGNLKG